MTKSQLISLVQRIRPDNRSREYDCHSWVQEVLASFRDQGHISSKTYRDSVDAMVEATLEAADDEWKREPAF